MPRYRMTIDITASSESAIRQAWIDGDFCAVIVDSDCDASDRLIDVTDKAEMLLPTMPRCPSTRSSVRQVPRSTTGRVSAGCSRAR